MLTLAGAKLQKLGGNAPASTLLFAKFSPDGRSVAYVRENNMYVEDLATGKVWPLTTDGSKQIITGTSDWVNEEELDLRDAFRGTLTRSALRTGSSTNRASMITR